MADNVVNTTLSLGLATMTGEAHGLPLVLSPR